MTVRDRNEQTVFESKALNSTNGIQSNDNDNDASRFEPHYAEITCPDQVQIYETIMVDAERALTTGLLRGLRYVKDNRLLPHGFDKRTADAQVAVHGAAEGDTDFIGGGDEVRYAVDVGDAPGPFRVKTELWYQPIDYR